MGCKWAQGSSMLQAQAKLGGGAGTAGRGGASSARPRLTISPSWRVVPEELMSISMAEPWPFFSRYISSATMSSVTAGTICAAVGCSTQVSQRRQSRAGQARRACCWASPRGPRCANLAAPRQPPQLPLTGMPM